MILYVGLANQTLVNLSQAMHPTAKLITENNVNEFFNVGYTGVEEFSDKSLFFTLLLSAKEIFYHPETFSKKEFDLNNPIASSQGMTENFLLLAKQQGVTVHNLSYLGQETIKDNLINYLELADIRKNIDGPQLWGAGCSFTYGSGVGNDQRYINLIGAQLDLPVNCLAQPGASITWAADQILRSDIRKDDIVIWGLTAKPRLPLIYKNKVTHASTWWADRVPGPEFDKKFLIQLLSDENSLDYRHYTCINQVTNFCNKIGAPLILLGLLTTPTELLYLHNNPLFYQFSVEYVDLGDDDMHPGPNQHKIYADIAVAQLQKVFK